MGKRALSKGSLSPIVRFTEKDGSKFVGVLTGKKPTQFGHLFSFVLESTTAPVKKKENEVLVDVDVKAGDDVAVFASTQLNDMLLQAKEGERVEITFHGLKLNPKSNRKFNDFDASVLE